MSKPTHTVVVTLEGNVKIKTTKELSFFKSIKGSSEYKCKKIVEEFNRNA